MSHDTMWLENKKQVLENIFSKDNKMIKSLSDELNNTVPSFNISNLAKIIDLDKAEVFTFIGLLASAVHFFVSHSKEWEDELKNSTLTTETKRKLNSFLSSLNDKGKKGLNLYYLSQLQLDEIDSITGTIDEFFLKTVYDEDGNVAGELPLVKFGIRKTVNNTHQESFYFLPLHIVKSVGEHFRRAYVENLENAKRYKNKIGDSVIIYDDE